MNFTIEKDQLLKELARIQGIVEKRNTIPVLANVLLESGDGQLLLTATDLEVGMRSSCAADISQPGRITVSAKKLYEITKELSDQRISFATRENSWIEVKCGKAQFNVVGLSADEFPHFPSPEKADFLTLRSQLCKEMIDKTLFAVSTDESKYNLNGIFVQIPAESNSLRMVATDGHRLSMIDKVVDDVTSEEFGRGVILPRKGIYELKKLADDGEGELKIGFMENNAVVCKGSTVVIMRLVDGDFPDYQRVIPQGNDNQAVISVEPLLHALRRMIILSSEKSRGVKMELANNRLEVSSSNPELGEAREELEIEYSGPELSVGFNARYLLDILQVQDQGKIRFFLKDQLSPGLVKPLQDDGFLAVVMPMRL
ncbi:MAG: DNA polymerase III subunit beta [Desulfuromonadales bacterium]|nr:DNA polymerase III subunit beta [Desulfuromonadales bacterium]